MQAYTCISVILLNALVHYSIYSAVIIGLDMETYTVMEGGSVNVIVAVYGSLADGIAFTVTLTASGTAGELQCKRQHTAYTV